MENTKQYWFYLEPYTFIFKSKNDFVVYNTLNSSYIQAPSNLIVSEVLTSLNVASNGYCIVLKEEQLLDSSFYEFAMQVRKTFSGDLVESETNTTKPFIFKPTLFLNTNIRKSKEVDSSFLGERILDNLNEVSIYLPGHCVNKCRYCKELYKQINHCTLFDCETLSLSNYLLLLLDLNESGVNKVNIIGSNLVQNEYLSDLLPTLEGCKLKKIYYVNFDDLSEKCAEWLQGVNSELVITVQPGFKYDFIKSKTVFWEFYNVRWIFIVTSEKDVLSYDNLQLPSSIQAELQPFYTGMNFQFFKDYVFCSLDDIISEPISRKVIFRRQTLNENFFGKLTILPSGQIFANLNTSPIGKYPLDSLKKIVFTELTDSTAWFYMREKRPCDSCVNKFLCPSISNYELVLEKSNLCFVKE